MTDGGPSLLADLAPGTESAAPGHFMQAGDTLFFAVNNGRGSRELWKTDGTAAGTVRVKSASIPFGPYGPSVSLSASHTWGAVDGALYFTDHVNGGLATLWRSDGTEAGTQQVRDSSGNYLNSTIRSGALGNALIIFRDGSWPVLELWRVEGTLATRFWTTTATGTGEASSAVRGRRFFTLGTAAQGLELWSTDGTATGTALVKDIQPGAGGSAPGNFTVVGDTLYFTADDGVLGRELWKTDGTEAGTVLVWDGRTGTESSGIQWLQSLGSSLLFAASNPSGGSRLWLSQGTSAGTTALLSGSTVSPVGTARGVAVGSVLYFTASTTAQGEELWKTDGTAAGTAQVKDLRPGSAGAAIKHLTPSGSLLYFLAEEGGGTRDLWRTDGTASGTLKVRTGPLPLELPGQPPAMVGMDGALLFSDDAPGMGAELWKTEGTESGTALLKDIRSEPSSSNPGTPVSLGSKVLFTALDGFAGRRLWASDGTTAGTLKLTDQPVNDHPLMHLGGHIYFTVNDTQGAQLWRTDGTPAGTGLVASSPRFFNAYFDFHAVVDGKLVFTAAGSAVNHAGIELWSTDGTGTGTQLIKDIRPNGDASPSKLLTVGKWVYFTAEDGSHGRELWKTDGTPDGTTLVKDINPGPAHGLTRYAALESRDDGTLFFAADDGVHGSDLWKTDGTEEGTMLVRDPAAGELTGTGAGNFVMKGQTLFFARNNPIELWKTDGTKEGTTPIQTSIPGVPLVPLSEVRGELLVAGNFNELWRTDGTPEGTVKVRKFPGGLGVFAKVHDLTYFIAPAPVGSPEGDELWRTDGTPEGTVHLAQVQPPSVDRLPGTALRFRGHLVFAADDGVHGREPQMMPLASLACPTTVTTEATSAAGATVTYPEATLADDAQQDLAVSYSLASGSTFSLGTTTVTAEARDPGYPLPSCSFSIIVRDTIPPQLTCPADISVQEPAPGQGATATFQADAADAVTASPSVSYAPASGSSFLWGATRVTATATDAAGNTSRCTFNVEVRPASVQPPPGPGDGGTNPGGTPPGGMDPVKPPPAETDGGGCACGAGPGGAAIWMWLGILGLWSLCQLGRKCPQCDPPAQ
ncbi:ELWxxDGT repeat protein [Hyalangium sp.]|uniref:ELWxxDGT repeat protein n=1 Tax=Hyalangium sp. TaxID=2028555 RepID=UPI002D51C141|nr:ELWxxDGT repeat protein [Hyalangium sp.]HYH96537.1 ELWxxDGT repeat protein [Hyalangium sp.]